jgi:hypothetical protein
MSYHYSIDFLTVNWNHTRDVWKILSFSSFRNFEAGNYPELNTKIVGELSETRSNQVDVQTNVDIWYGLDFQNDAKHIVLRLDMKKTSDYREQSASILTSIKYPAFVSQIYEQYKFSLDLKLIYSHRKCYLFLCNVIR